ncbi:MAG TPA: energy transducer TonB [Allosphingosinicella sp.]|jgi:TonB family protein
MNLLLGLLLAAPAAPAPIVAAPAGSQVPGTIVSAPAAAPAGPAPATRAAPTAPIPRLINAEDYPAAALRAGEQGTVRVGLDVSPEGRVTACTITASSKSASLDATTCRILRSRARFTPARDSAGTAVADRFETSLGWKLSRDVQVPAPVQAAMGAWAECIGPVLAKEIQNSALSAQAVADRAFAPCVAVEDKMLAAVRAAVSEPRPIAEDRAMLRGQVVARIEAARKPKQP